MCTEKMSSELAQVLDTLRPAGRVQRFAHQAQPAHRRAARAQSTAKYRDAQRPGAASVRYSVSSAIQ